MRAIYLNQKNLALGKSYQIIGAKHHHLANVVRVKNGESILVLNGDRHSYVGRIIEIDKKSITITLQEKRVEKNILPISVAYALTKKDALEKAIVAASEIGLERFIPLKTAFSQKLQFNSKRLEKILQGSMEQSNRSLELNVEEPTPLHKISTKDYQNVVVFSSRLNAGIEEFKPSLMEGKTLIIIGPEGGLTEEEEMELIKKKNAYVVKFDTPILRSETALVFASGYIMACLL